MIQFHRRVFDTFKCSGTWAGISGALGAMASQVPAPHSAQCAYASGFCAIMAVLVRSPYGDLNPPRPDDPAQDGVP